MRSEPVISAALLSLNDALLAIYWLFAALVIILSALNLSLIAVLAIVLSLDLVVCPLIIRPSSLEITPATSLSLPV